MQKQSHINRSSHQRPGILSMELVLTLPVLMVLLLGTFEFTCLFFSYGSVAEASRAGARQATLNGVLEEDVRNAVHRSLSPKLSASADIAFEGAEHSGEEVVCGIRIPMTACAPNLLWPIGFDLNNEYIECTTRMTKE